MSAGKWLAVNLALVAAGVLAAFLIADVGVRVTGLAKVSPTPGCRIADHRAPE